MRRAALLVVAGCGRFSFEAVAPPEDAEVDSAFAPTTDAPLAAMTRRFGECSNADVTDVTIDTSLDSTRPDENTGRRIEMRIGNGRVSLVRFHVSSIAAATVFSATLEISVAPTDGLEQGDAQVFALRESWVEGAGDFSQGVANWTQRDATTTWSVAGAGPLGSRSDQVMGVFTPRVAGARHFVALDAAAVQAWVQGANFGMAIAAINEGSNGGWLATREATDAATRPCLVVTYVP